MVSGGISIMFLMRRGIMLEGMWRWRWRRSKGELGVCFCMIDRCIFVGKSIDLSKGDLCLDMWLSYVTILRETQNCAKHLSSEMSGYQRTDTGYTYVESCCLSRSTTKTLTRRVDRLQHDMFHALPVYHFSFPHEHYKHMRTLFTRTCFYSRVRSRRVSYA
jgi:hypothetical protein